LTREHLGQIADMQLHNVGELLKDRKVKLEVAPAAKDRIIAEGYDPQYGARPMKRAVQRLIQDPLALKLIHGEFTEGDTIMVDAKEGENELEFSKKGTDAFFADPAKNASVPFLPFLPEVPL
jgi:ATP-dependent Clp protease ATP-binding subunit ClpB